MKSAPVRIQLIAMLAALAVAGPVVLAGCGDDGGIEDGQTSVDVSTAEAEGEPSGDLTVSNWALYVDKETIPEFEQSTGIDMKYVEDINSYDEFFAKMQPLLADGESGGRSLMVASDWLAKKLYDLGYIQKLDKDALEPALSRINPDLRPSETDPDHDFSIPWQGGMTGLIVNQTEAPEITSVNDIFDPQYKGRVELVSELRETVPLVMKAEGIDPAEATTDDWLAAIDKIGDAIDSGQIRRVTGGDYSKDLATGDAVAVIGWAADANQLQADNPDLQWVMPDEGCIIWYDNWVVPVGAPNPTAAYEWINYTYEPHHQAQIDAYVNAITPVAGVQKIFERTDPELAKNPLIFPDKDSAANCSSTLSPPGSPAEQRPVEKAWSEALTG